MNKLDYWIEAVEYALEEIDKIDIFSGDEIKNIAENIQISDEQEGMAFGTDIISNPLLVEIENLKNLHAKEIEKFENREKTYCKGIAKCITSRDGICISENEIHIENGDVIIRRR